MTTNNDIVLIVPMQKFLIYGS